MTYDDGDEEVLGEVDGRTDVHLLGDDSSRNDDASEVGLLEPSGGVQHLFSLDAESQILRASGRLRCTVEHLDPPTCSYDILCRICTVQSPTHNKPRDR